MSPLRASLWESYERLRDNPAPDDDPDTDVPDEEAS